MKIVFHILFVCLTTFSFSQVKFSQTHFDLGEINGDEPRFVDVEISNHTKENVFLLSVKAPHEVVYSQHSSLMQPGMKNTVRIQVSKKSKGKFNYQIPIYTSYKKVPTIIYVKGKIGSSPSSAMNLTSCPTFDQVSSPKTATSFQLTVEVADEETGKILENATVNLKQSRSKIGTWKTKQDGQFSTNVPLGITTFEVHRGGYRSYYGKHYVNYKSNYIRILLHRSNIPESKKIEKEPIPEEEEIEEQLEEEIEIVERDSILTPTPPKRSVPKTVELDTLPQEDFYEIPELLARLDSTNFDDRYFTAVNVTFVIDVSGSMRNYGRMTLLRNSLEELVKFLRPQDKMGVVSYAEEANIIMATTSANRKSKIIKKIEELEASGRTAGGDGIKKGYEQVKRNKLNDGANHLIIITDGAFNHGSDDYKQYIKDNLENDGITMSVVGLKCNKKAAENMRETAALGKGRLILINNNLDARGKLNQEIRLRSFRR